jgi:hypothetical protein
MSNEPTSFLALVRLIIEIALAMFIVTLGMVLGILPLVVAVRWLFPWAV